VVMKKGTVKGKLTGHLMQMTPSVVCLKEFTQIKHYKQIEA